MKKSVLRVALIEFIFSKPEELAISYGAACLKAAFDTSEYKLSGDSIQIFAYNLESFKTEVGYAIDTPILLEKVWEDLESFKPTIIACSVFVWSDNIVKEMGMKLTRQTDRQKPLIVLGGPMICGCEVELKSRYSFADYFIISYGEKIFSNLRAYLNSHSVVKNLPQINDLHSPYLSGVISVQQGMSIRMETHRGCIYRCPFCQHSGGMEGTQIVGTKQRFRQELEMFRDNSVRKLNILNPLFNHKKDYEVLLDLVKELRIEIPLSVQIRCESLTDDFLDRIKELPNIICEIGVQSLSPASCKFIQRNPQKTLEWLQKLHQHSIMCEVSLIYGLPEQTFQDFEDDILKLRKMGVSKISAFPLQLYPGTKFFQERKDLPFHVRQNSLGILEVYENSTGDFLKMKELAEKLTR